jgi:LPXTG-motif cell wall-anchored protein
MIETVITFLEHNLIPLGAGGIFLASIIEAIIVPIPSAAVLYASGFLFLSSLSGLSFYSNLLFVVAIPAAIGGTIGSYVIYGLGYFFGKPFFERSGKWIGITWEEIEGLRLRFSKGPRDEITLIVLRSIPIIPAAALSALAGIIRMKPLNYGFSTLIGSIVRGLILAWIGGEVGFLYKTHLEFVNKWESVILAIGVLVLVGVGVFLFKRKRRHMLQ